MADYTALTKYNAGDFFPVAQWNYTVDNFTNHEDRITQNEADIATNAAGIASIGVLPDFLNGLEISNNGSDSEHDIDIAAGTISADDQSKYLILASGLTKKIDAAFSKGTNQGGLDTGSVAAGTFYYFWAIEEDSSSDIDVLISASTSSPTMPSGWTAKGLTGDVILTDGSGNIIPFRLIDNNIRYNVMIHDVAEFPASTARQAKVFNVPPNYIGIFNFTISYSAAGLYILQETTDTDVTLGSDFSDLRSSTSMGNPTIECHRKVNASRQLYYKSDNTSAFVRVKTHGFINPKR